MVCFAFMARMESSGLRRNRIVNARAEPPGKTAAHRRLHEALEEVYALVAAAEGDA